MKEVIVPGTEHASIFHDIRNLDKLNNYVNKLSEFMTSKTIFISTDKQKLAAEDDAVKKKNNLKKPFPRNPNSDSEGEQ